MAISQGKATTPKLKRRKRSRKRQDFILYSYNVINEESSYLYLSLFNKKDYKRMPKVIYYNLEVDKL